MYDIYIDEMSLKFQYVRHHRHENVTYWESGIIPMWLRFQYRRHHKQMKSIGSSLKKKG